MDIFSHLQKVSSWTLGKVLNPPAQWLQLRCHDSVKALYDNPKMRSAFWKNTIQLNQLKGSSILDYLIFCFTQFFHTAQNTVVSHNFLVGKFCEKARFPNSFGQFATRPKLCGNCAFPQNFHTRKLGEITAFYAAAIDIFNGFTLP